MKRAAIGVVAAGIGCAWGQDLGIKAPPQAEPVAIVGAEIHTVSSGVIDRGWVLFEGGIITEVGEGERGFGGGVRVIEGEGLRVYPGLIGAVTQTGLTEFGAVAATRDVAETGELTPEVRAVVAVNPDSTIIPVTRANGVLTVGVFPEGGLVSGRAGVIRMDGWTWEGMAVEGDAGVVVRWPWAGPVRGRGFAGLEEEGARRARERVGRIEALFDAAAAYGRARSSGAEVPVDIRLEALQGVLPGEGQKPVYVFAQRVDQIVGAVRWGASRGLKVVIVGGREAPLCAELLREHGVGVIVEGTHSMPGRDDAAYDEAFALPARLASLGVRWCLASGEETPHERNLPYQAATAVAYGLESGAAVRAITLSAAEMLGVGDRLGSIDPGKAATLIVTDGDVLEVRTEVVRAFIDGREIDLWNKHKALAEKYREKYRQMRASGGGQ